MTFETWKHALPYAVARGKALAQRCPVPLDVESVVMEALWKAHCAGNTFSRHYVWLRVRGALLDEMRRLAEGERRNYQHVRSFVDVDDAWDLHSNDGDDLADVFDRKRLIESLPDAARTLMGRVVSGSSLEEIAAEQCVTGARVCQVLTRLKAHPHKVTRLPGQVDFYAELRTTAKAEVRRRLAGKVRFGEMADALGACNGSAFKWANGTTTLPSCRATSLLPSPVRDAVRDRALRLVADAFRRADGRHHVAARLLTVSPMTAYRWGRILPAGSVPSRNTRRPELLDSQFAELRARGLSLRQIARSLGVDKSTVKQRLTRAATAKARAEAGAP